MLQGVRGYLRVGMTSLLRSLPLQVAPHNHVHPLVLEQGRSSVLVQAKAVPSFSVLHSEGPDAFARSVDHK
jgi:hypothetical protein